MSPSSPQVAKVTPTAALLRPELNPYNVAIPEEFGSVEEVFQGTENSPLIVHIQNVHANYEAQVNIKGILNHLVEKYQFSLVQLEGAVSKLDPAILQPSYLKEANLKLVDFLMREGRITGADAFAVETDKPVELHGIEDYTLYKENLRMFKTIYKRQKDLKPYLNEIHRLILNIAPKLFAPELLDFTRKTEEFSTDKIDILDYLVYMNQLSERHGFGSLNDLKQMVEYPNLVRLMRLRAIEEKLNKSGLKKETEALKVEFQKRMPNSQKAENLLARLDESAKGVSPRSYFVELTELADEANIDFIGYPAFRVFAEFLIHQDEIDHRALFSELKKFEQFIQGKLFTSGDEKTLLAMIDFVSLLEQYFRLEMSREKIALYLKNKDQIKPSWISERLGELAEKYGVVARPAGDVEQLDSYMAEVEYFYQLVLKRDRVFTEKIISKMRSLGEEKTILVTGGFHKDGLIDYFRKENISYVVVNPKVDIKQGNENYVKVMLEEDAVVGSVFAGTFALEGQRPDLLVPFRWSTEVIGVGLAATMLELKAIDKNFLRDQQNRYLQIAENQPPPNGPISLRLVSPKEIGLRRQARTEIRTPSLDVFVRAEIRKDTGEFSVVAERVQEKTKIQAEPAKPFKLPKLNPTTLSTISRPLQSPLTASEISSPRIFPADTVVLPNGPYDNEVTKLISELGGVTPAGAKQLRERVIAGGRLTPAEIRTAKAVTGLGRPVGELSQAQIKGLALGEKERGLFNALVKPFDQEFFIALVLDTESQPEVSRAKLRSLVTAVQLNGKLAATVFGVDVRHFMMDSFGLPEERLADEPFKRILFLDEARRGVPMTNFDQAIGIAETFFTVRYGALLNFFVKAVPSAKGMSMDQFRKNFAFSIPAGKAGERLSLAVADISSETHQIFELDLESVRDLEVREAIGFFITLVASKLGVVEAAALIRELGDEAVKQTGPYRWRVLGTSGALKLISHLYQAYLKIAVAA
ncbi:MAG: hypothetical protein HY584_04885 [Candidatus Omnitrophica bacterium]|nr:hypothetical protein [Candidatus Omnitrophota bacterium]